MKVEVRESEIHGLGVFAAEDIPKGEIIEVCNILLFDKKDTEFIDKTSLYDYYFGWEDDENINAIALGNGSLYNHSYAPNAMYKKDVASGKLIFTALRLIRKGEEIVINYNEDPESKEKVWFDK